MSKTAEDYEKDYTEPELRERLKDEIMAGDKGGKPGQWSARKSQLLTHEYESHGGGYKHEGQKTDAQKSLENWTGEEWQTQDGGDAEQGDGTMKRYLPKAAWDQLSDEEKKDTEAKKRAASKHGKQFVDNTDAARAAKKKVKTAEDADKLREMTAAELHELAGDFEIEGRSSMAKDELIHALQQAAMPGGSGHSDGDGDGKTKAELYEQAKNLEVEGRSKMDKDELAGAVEKAK